jgi:PAT family beta-lactamase induction signal transducer AmpG
MIETTPTAGPWVLERSRKLRLFTLFILYVGQGMPIGLMWFAIPAWMAVGGAGAADIATVAALTALPWSLKLVNGFIMDRYAYLPMGRRRAWLLAAQAAIIVCLCAAALADPGPGDIAFLAATGFAVNLAAAFQDVAVDGLAVDIMTEDERARGSGAMFGGQALGIAGASACSGLVIEAYGAPAAFLAIAALMLLLAGYVTAWREREGERLLPWTEGRAHPRNRVIQIAAWPPLLRATFVSLTDRVSLLWLPVIFARGIFYGAMVGITPLIGANLVGLSTAEIASLTGTAGLIGGVLGMTLGGWLGDRFGAKRTSVFWLAVQLAGLAAMLLARTQWSDPAVFVAFVVGWFALDLMVSISSLPIAMRLCEPSVAATQFTIYMGIGNLGISAGAWVLGQAGMMGLGGVFLAVAAWVTLAMLLMMMVPFPRRGDVYVPMLSFDSHVPMREHGGMV